MIPFNLKLTIELDREVDGRWIAEVPELNVLLYGDSEPEAKKDGWADYPFSFHDSEELGPAILARISK